MTNAKINPKLERLYIKKQKLMIELTNLLNKKELSLLAKYERTIEAINKTTTLELIEDILKHRK